jgi:hypothetical protein
MIYAEGMTLSVRNYCFKAEIITASLALILILAAASSIFPVYPNVGAESARRSAGLVQGFIAAVAEPAPYAPFISMLGAAIYSLISIALIYYFFEKTQSPEIFFVSLFVISFSFECIRIMVPLRTALELSTVYLITTSRVLIFGRYLGLFSLFTASICAAGLEVRKQQNVVFVIIAATLIIALGVPIDGLAWDSSLNMLNGSSSMFLMVEAGILIITAASFFVSAYTKGSKEYAIIGLGCLLAWAGRNILLSADTWITPLPGLVILSAGTWFICTELHRVYLWL